MRIHLTAIILFMSVSSAQADLTGKWRVFVTGIDTDISAQIEWTHCTIDFLASGAVKTSTSSCKSFDGGTVTFTSAAKLTVGAGCAVTGTLTLTATGDSDVNRVIVSSAQMDTGKSVIAGVGRTNVVDDRLSFTAIKQ